MKLTLLFLVLFVMQGVAATLSFKTIIDFDSSHTGAELRIWFETPNHSSDAIVFNTNKLDSINFQVVRETNHLSLAITDPILYVMKLPFQSEILGSISLKGSLFGSDISPDLYLQSEELEFFHSMEPGDFEIETTLNAHSTFSVEFQNFAGEIGRFHLEIVAAHVPEIWMLPYAYTLFALLSQRKRQTPSRVLALGGVEAKTALF
ncbi:MAG TPA: hypothetical protein VEC13_02090 [Candidatus Paceibacterota bacterium]|nr:hypothetical protein [Candidatus Paceibacterota bacterium]